MPSEDDATARHLVRADLVFGVVLLVLGLAFFYLSWAMPRLEVRRIHPSTVPGLVPGLLGLLLVLCGGVLAARSLPSLRDLAGWRRFGRLLLSPEAGRAGLVAAFALVYPLGLVGVLPFWLATTLFVFAFVVTFDVFVTDRPRPLLRTVLGAGVQAALVALAVVLVFQYGFLVRLP